MTVEEMLAAARAEKSGGAKAAPKKSPPPAESPAAPPAEPAAEEASEAPSEAPAEKPAAKPAAAKKPGAMSVAEMLAAARAEKSGGAKLAAAPQPKAEPKAEAKPAPKAPAAKPAPAAKAGAEKAAPEKTAKAAGTKDTASILADAPKGAKPGPLSKAEAAAKGQEPLPEKRKAAVPPMPAKPAYARPAAAAPADQQDRRGFLNSMMAALVGTPLAIGFSSLAITHLLWVLGFARFMFPNILTEPPTRFRVGFPDEYAPGQVQEKYKAQFGVWIVRHEYEGQTEIYALKSVCTHLGCTPNWLEGEQKFKCPCHGSGFYKDGINFEGPAPRPLERYAIKKADDGQIEVDKSRVFFEEKGEWKDPASFVTV